MAKKEELNKLFGMDASRIITDALIFQEPDKEEWIEASERLNNLLTKNQLWAMCQALQPLLHTHGAVMVKMKSNGKNRPATELQSLFSQSTNKMDMARGLALILCKQANLQHYADRLKPEQRELWQLLLSKIYVSIDEAKQVLKEQRVIIEEQHRGYYYYNKTEKLDPPELMFFTITRSLSATKMRYGYRQKATFLTVPPAIYPYFYNLFFPEAKDTAAKPGNDHIVCNFEADSVAKYPLLQGLIKADKLQVKTKGVGLSDIKRVGKTLALDEIFGNEAVKNSLQENIRTLHYIQLPTLYHYFNSYQKTGDDTYAEMLRNLFCEDQYWLDSFFVQLLLPHIKGLRRQIVECNTLKQLFYTVIRLLKEEPKNWIATSDIMQHTLSIATEEPTVPYMPMVFRPEGQSDAYDIENEFSHRKIDVGSFVPEFGLAAIQAQALLLCSLGMAEVALSPLHRSESPFARTDYLRLTPLGRYALKVSNKYEAPHIEQAAYFELDPERLIIRSLVTPNPYEQLLKNSSVAISKNRFETSARSFLAHCKSRDDVEKHIAIFRQFISSDLPPLWKQFFDSLLQHCHPLTKSQTSYCHFNVSPEDTDLIYLLTNDEKLRHIVVRAEGYLILVKNSDLRLFEEQLKKHGYLL